MKRNSSKMMKLHLYFVFILLVVQLRNLDAGVVRTTRGYTLNDGYTGSWWTPPQCIACLKAISMEYFNNIQTLVPYCPKQDIYDFESVDSTYYLRNICEYQYPDYFFDKYELLRYNAEFVFGMFKRCLENGLTYEDREALLEFEEAFEEGRRKCGMENYLKEEIAKFREMYMPPEMPSIRPSAEHNTSLEMQPKPEENAASENMKENSTMISDIVPKVSPHHEKTSPIDELVKHEQTYDETESESDQSSKPTHNESKLNILSDTPQETLETSNIIHNDPPKVDVNAPTSTTTHKPMPESRSDDIPYHQQEPPALTVKQESQDLPTALPKSEYKDAPDTEKNVEHQQKTDESTSLEDASKTDISPFSNMRDELDLHIQNDIESRMHQNPSGDVPEPEVEDELNNTSYSPLPNTKIIDDDSKTYESLIDLLLGRLPSVATVNATNSIPQENNQLRLNQSDSELHSTLEPNLEDVSKYVTNSMQNNTNITENDTRTKDEDGLKDISNNFAPVNERKIDVSLNTDELSKSSFDDSSRLGQNSSALENILEEKLEDGSEDSTNSNPDDVKMTDSTIITDDMSLKTLSKDSSSRFDQNSLTSEKILEPKFREGLKDEVNSLLSDLKVSNEDFKTDDPSPNHESPVLASAASQLTIQDLSAQTENQSLLDENSSASGNTSEEKSKEGSKDSSDSISLDNMIHTTSNTDDTSMKSPINDSSSSLNLNSSASATSSEQKSEDKLTDEINSVPSGTNITDDHLRTDEPSINLQSDVSSSRLNQTNTSLPKIPEPKFGEELKDEVNSTLSDLKVSNEDLKTHDPSLNHESPVLTSTASQHIIQDLSVQTENQSPLDENSSASGNTSEEKSKEGSKDSSDSISLDNIIHTTSNADDISVKSPINDSSSSLDLNSSASATSSEQKSEDKLTDEINSVPSGTNMTDNHLRTDEPSINLQSDVSSSRLNQTNTSLPKIPEPKFGEELKDEVNSSLSDLKVSNEDLKTHDPSLNHESPVLASNASQLTIQDLSAQTENQSLLDENSSASGNTSEEKSKEGSKDSSDSISLDNMIHTTSNTDDTSMKSPINDSSSSLNLNSSASATSSEQKSEDKLTDEINSVPSGTNITDDHLRTDEPSINLQSDVSSSRLNQTNTSLPKIPEPKFGEELKDEVNSTLSDLKVSNEDLKTHDPSLNHESPVLTSTASQHIIQDLSVQTENQSPLDENSSASGNTSEEKSKEGSKDSSDSISLDNIIHTTSNADDISVKSPINDSSSSLDLNSSASATSSEQKSEDKLTDEINSVPSGTNMTDNHLRTDEPSINLQSDVSSSKLNQTNTSLPKIPEPKFGEELKDEVNSSLSDLKVSNEDLKTHDPSLNHESPVLTSTASQHIIQDLSVQTENQSPLDENSSASGNTSEEKSKEGSKDSSDSISLDNIIHTTSNADDISVKSPINDSSSSLDLNSPASATSSEQKSEDKLTDEINSVPSGTNMTDNHLRTDEPSINLQSDVSSSRLNQTNTSLPKIPEPKFGEELKDEVNSSLSDLKVSNEDLKTHDPSLNHESPVLASNASQHTIQDLSVQTENQSPLDENNSASGNTSEEKSKEGSKDSSDSISLDNMIHTTSNTDDTSMKSPINDSSSSLNLNSSASATSSEQKSEDKLTDEINSIPSGTKMTDDHSRSYESLINLKENVSSPTVGQKSSMLENTPEQELEDETKVVKNVIPANMKKTNTSHDMNDSSIKFPSDDLSSISHQNNSALRNISEPEVDNDVILSTSNNIKKTDDDSKNDDLSIDSKLDTLLSTTLQHVF